MTVDTEKYLEFVDGVTSDPSKDLAYLLRRISQLEIEQDCDVPHLLTAALGLLLKQVSLRRWLRKSFFRENHIMKIMCFI